jgi:hypothetical protein
VSMTLHSEWYGSGLVGCACCIASSLILSVISKYYEIV